jgi:hypothetical protein
MLIKKRNFIFSFLIASVLLMMNSGNLNAQNDISLQNRLKSILSTFNNVRFSSVDYYELSDKQVRALKEIIKSKLDMEEENADETPAFNQQGVDSARLDTLAEEVRRLMANGARTFNDVRRAFNGDKDDFEYLEDYNANDIELRTAFQMAQPRQVARADIYRMFMITTPVREPGLVPDIIALILCKQRIDKVEYETALIQFYNEAIGNSLANDKNVLTYPELMNFIIEENASGETKATNLYDRLVLEYRQGNFQLITQEVRGIGTELKFTNSYGTSTSMIYNENDITSQDVAKFVRVSEGQPFDYTKTSELVVGPDLISYKKYNIEYYQTEEGELIPYNEIANSDLPTYGVELKYGLDEINYPSFWSERMALRAVWDNMKLGIVLPTFGWSSLSDDLFSIERKMTHAGIGLSGSIDLPIKIIPQSGIFSVTGSYVFGDAQEAKYKGRQDLYDEFTAEEVITNLYEIDNPQYNDYLIRYTAKLHYTFGFSIDEFYMLRFGIGATVYGAETWRDYWEVNEETGDGEVLYKKADDETVGGISMKVEFMATSATTPFGASLQYFDESLFANAWIQIPVIRDTFFLRFEANGFVAAFKEVLHPWENKGVFLPSARLIFNF